jgi:hypothetical protein
MDAATWCRHLVPDGSVYAFLADAKVTSGGSVGLAPDLLHVMARRLDHGPIWLVELRFLPTAGHRG